MTTNRTDSDAAVLALRCPRKLVAAIDEAASARLQSKSDYVRQLILEALKADGVKVA